MKSVTMVELRTQSQAIVRRLKKGEVLELHYRGKPLAELRPLGRDDSGDALRALDELHDASSPTSVYRRQLQSYLREVAEARREYGSRTGS